MSQNLGDPNYAADARGALNTTLALHPHAVVKVTGKSEDLDDLRGMLSARLNRNRAATTLQLTSGPAA